jgi:NMD protein affecting ribosome stability and mRNA decay
MSAGIRCGKRITTEEYETYQGMCEECYETEIDELDYEDDY